MDPLAIIELLLIIISSIAEAIPVVKLPFKMVTELFSTKASLPLKDIPNTEIPSAIIALLVISASTSPAQSAV